MAAGDTQRSNAVLGEEIRCAEAMLETLGREHRALTDGDPAALGAATEAKAKLVDALEKLESQRQSLGGGDALPDTAEAQRLRELIGRCKEQNQRNGALLQARAENVRVALKTLRGSEPELYGATGRTPTRVDARNLGTA
jgi:flagellar biosynthesis/type III secretory pathway chaperone